MHPDSMRLMAEVKRKYLGYLDAIERPYVCDDGGLCSSPDKSYRTLFYRPPGAYLCYDIVAHPSVDVV